MTCLIAILSDPPQTVLRFTFSGLSAPPIIGEINACAGSTIVDSGPKSPNANIKPSIGKSNFFIRLY